MSGADEPETSIESGSGFGVGRSIMGKFSGLSHFFENFEKKF